jgi:hypothetical protein
VCILENQNSRSQPRLEDFFHLKNIPEGDKLLLNIACATCKHAILKIMISLQTRPATGSFSYRVCSLPACLPIQRGYQVNPIVRPFYVLRSSDWWLRSTGRVRPFGHQSGCWNNMFTYLIIAPYRCRGLGVLFPSTLIFYASNMVSCLLKCKTSRQ